MHSGHMDGRHRGWYSTPLLTDQARVVVVMLRMRHGRLQMRKWRVEEEEENDVQWKVDGEKGGGGVEW